MMCVIESMVYTVLCLCSVCNEHQVCVRAFSSSCCRIVVVRCCCWVSSVDRRNGRLSYKRKFNRMFFLDHKTILERESQSLLSII